MKKKNSPPYLSPSQINTYLNCPRIWFNKYILGIDDSFKFALIRGSMVHKCIEDFFRVKVTEFDKFEGGDYYESMKHQMMEIFKKRWKSPMMHQLCVKDGLDYDNVKQETIDTLMNFIYLHWMNARAILSKTGSFNKAWYYTKPKMAEQKLESERHHLKGIVDCVVNLGGEKVIVDYKTSSIFKIPYSKEYKLQLMMYSLLIRERHREFIGIASNFYLKHGIQSFYFFEESDLEEVEKLIAEIWEKTRSQEQSDYPCNTDFIFCGPKYCTQMTEDCPCSPKYVKKEESNEEPKNSENPFDN